MNNLKKGLESKEKADAPLAMAGVVLTTVIFVLDMNLPLGVAGGVPYIAVVLIGLWVSTERYILTSAISSSVLTIIGFFLSPQGGEIWKVVFNRSLALFAIWVTAILCHLQKRNQAALQNSEDHLRQIVEHAEDGIIVIDQDGVVDSFNPAAERIFGYQADDLVGKGIHELMPEPYNRDHDGYIQKYLQTGQGKIIGIGPREVIGKRKNGSTIPVELTVSEMFMDKQRWFIGIARDISQRKTAEIKLQMYASELELSNQALGSFAAITSHDLKEPLRKIILFGDRLEELYGDVLEARGHDYLDRMRKATQRMLQLIEGLLEYSRIHSKGKSFEPVDLIKVTTDVLDDFEIQITETKGTIEVENLPTLDADPLQMRQLFQNLIGNALKFHKTNEAPTVHVISQKKPDGLWEITFEDNGIGFDEKYLHKIFQPFEQLHGQSEFDGSGMGMAICKRIIDRHGGTITASSQPGKGTTFIVTLPEKQNCMDTANIQTSA